MRFRLSLFVIVLIAGVVVVATVALAAESLPSFLWLTTGSSKSLGEAGVAGGSGTSEVAQFNSPITITATYFLVELFAESTTGMADEGQAVILLEGEKVSGTAGHCFTSGDSESKGAVLIDNATWRLVLDLSGNTYVLLNIPEFTLLCPGSFPSSIKIKGAILGKVSPFGGGEHSTMTTEMQCASKGSTMAKWKEYDTHEGAMASVVLLANGGLGFSEACKEAFSPITASFSTPTEIMEP